MDRLTDAEIDHALIAIPSWSRVGSAIRRRFEFVDFPSAVGFVNRVAKLAEEAQHHPDIDIRWNRVVLELTTHDSGGLTARDFELAIACDRVVNRE